ncbi:hypothetical protein ACQKCJ_08820 [Flavobacterium sp. NPDC079362]|uniref:hypothetical protein n=1 Tax=Flavobacterium sp. NPDC079362 TaxID=3390566 RepID=UPI003D0139DD
MKKIITLLLLVSSAFIFSQNRQDDKLPIISKEIKGQIISANGWKKNQYGKWVTAKNKIPYDIEQQFKSLINFEVYSLGNSGQNFISYQLKDVKINDTTYSLLIEKYRDGFYKYETIQEGWVNSNSYKYYVFDKNQLENLKKINDDSIHTFEILLLQNDEKHFINLSTISDNVIAKEINSVIKDPTPYTKKTLFITIRKFKSKNIIQFFISTYYYGFSEDMYYETDLLNFNKFLKLE